MTFEELGLDEDLLEAVRDLGYENPTPIQEACIGKLLKGFDLIGQSKTGTGKTAAFGIPLTLLIDPDDRRMQALVLCPTRELCMQVAEDLRRLLKYKSGIRVVPVYGGQPIAHQINDLKKGAQIIVGTPGRFIDHVRRHTLRTEQVQMVVLDEADEMFSMGFKDDIDLILAQLPVPRQTVLFSATMPEEVEKLAKQYMEEPSRIHIGEEDSMTVDQVKQYYYELRPGQKTEALLRLLKVEDPKSAIIFCNTKKRVSDLTEELKDQGIQAEGLHGDLKQVQRDLVMRRFRGREIKLLIATDVAARGLDISDVELIVHYDLPEDDELYVHRTGRTARAGKSGKSYVFVSPKELERLSKVASFTGANIEARKIPTLQEIEEARKQRILKDLRLILKENSQNAKELTFGRIGKYEQEIQTLKSEGYPAEQIAAGLLLLSLYVPSDQTDELSRTPKRYLAKTDKESMVRLYINLGKQQKIRVKDLTGLLEEKCGITYQMIGRIDLLESFTYMEIPSSLASSVIEEIDGTSLRGHRLHVELAKS